MHDPQTVAFEIKYPWKRHGYRPSFITVWHVDPERDGTDDSCGWFMRSRHGSKKVLDNIARRFEYEWSRQFTTSSGQVIETGLFDGSPANWPVLSLHAIALNLFFYASIECFGRDKAQKFMQKHLFNILLFAENPVDSMHDAFTNKFGIDERDTKERRARNAAVMIYGWILRNSRPWYKHPRWHVWHWKLQIHPLQAFKRWAFSRCAKCGRGFQWGESPISYSWHGTGPRWFRSERDVQHSNCAGCGVTANPESSHV